MRAYRDPDVGKTEHASVPTFRWGKHSPCIEVGGGQAQVANEDDGQGDYHMVLSEDVYSSGTHRFEISLLNPDAVSIGFIDHRIADDLILEDDDHILEELSEDTIYFRFNRSSVYNLLDQSGSQRNHVSRIRRHETLVVELSFTDNYICFYKNDAVMYKWESAAVQSRMYQLVVSLDYEEEGVVLTKYLARVPIFAENYPCARF